MKWQLPNSECHKTIMSRDIHGSPSAAILQTHLPKTVPTGCVEMRGDWNNRSRRPPFGLATQSLLRAASKAVEKGKRLAMIALLAKASREMQAGASGRRRLRLTAISALQLEELACWSGGGRVLQVPSVPHGLAEPHRSWGRASRPLYNCRSSAARACLDRKPSA